MALSLPGQSGRRPPAAMTSKIEHLRQALRDLSTGTSGRDVADGARFLFYELVSASVIPKHAPERGGPIRT